MSAGDPERAADFDPLDPSFVQDPHATWERLRRQCPVARGAHWDFWAATKYADVKQISRQPKLFTSSQGITVPRNPVSGRRAPLHFDPPEHPRYRRPLNVVFSDSHVAELEPDVRCDARALVSELAGAGGGDIVAGLSSPLTGLVFGKLIGLPRTEALALNGHSERFEWAQGHRHAEIAEEENLYLYSHFRELVRRRRSSPGDPERDVVSALLAVRIDGELLDDEFVAGSVRQLLIAAHVAPTAAIASGVRHLAEDRRLQDQLRRNPDLIPDAVEEVLRMYTPNQGFSRTAVRTTQIRGTEIQAGEQIALVLTSANRDEEVFPDSDCFILGRSPNPHIAFGHGAHKCAGQAVARMEMRVALEELLSLTSNFTLTGKESPVGWPLYGPEVLQISCNAGV